MDGWMDGKAPFVEMEGKAPFFGMNGWMDGWMDGYNTPHAPYADDSLAHGGLGVAAVAPDGEGGDVPEGQGRW